MMLRVAGVARCRSESVSCALLVALANLWLAPAYAQSGSASARAQVDEGRVENTQVVINGAMVNISYDLIAARGQSTFAVELEASQDGGKTYVLKPKTVTGDVGAAVAAGAGKKLVWEAAKDTDNLQLAQLKFRVVARADTSRTTQTGVAPPTSTPRQPQSVKPVQPPSSAGRNRLVWPSLGLMGGGVLLGVLAAKGSLRNDDPYLPSCLQYFGPSTSYCDGLRATMTNKPIVGVGLGMAGAGVALFVLGAKRRASQVTSIAPVSKGFVIFHAVQF